MSFGPVMRFEVGRLTIELAPIDKNSVAEFVIEGRLQHHSVSKYLGRLNAPVLEDEQEWFDKVRTDKACITWGIWDVTGERTLIGTSSLNGLEGEHMRQRSEEHTSELQSH